MGEKLFTKGQYVRHVEYGLGTVVKDQSEGCSINVEFDVEMGGHALGGIAKHGHGWCCNFDKLMLVGGSKLPFEVGDKVEISSRPSTWSGLYGVHGRDDVTYPYIFIVKRISDEGDYISIFDGTYGWTYYQKLFKKVSSSSKFVEVKDDEIKEKILKRR